MRVGIVGAGFMGTVHAAAWAVTDATVAGVLPGPSTPADEVTGRLGLPVYPDLDALLGDVDVVDVCAPTDVHHDLVLAAAAAGLDVICEKPLARTVEQGEAMVAACHDAGVALLVAHVVRFFPEYAAARAAVDRGEVGTPAVLRLSRGSFRPRKPTDSFASRETSPPAKHVQEPAAHESGAGASAEPRPDNFASRETRAGASAEPRPDNWYLDEARSGGLVLDLMIHDLDFARWVAGDVSTVYAKRVRPTGRALPGDGVQHAFAILRHHSGALSHIEASWAYPPPVFRTSAEIAGTTGLLEFDSEASAPVRMYVHATGDAGDVGLPRSPLREPPHTTQIRHFVDVLRGDAEPVVTAHDGLAALRLAAAAAESITGGQPVALRGASARVPAGEIVP